MEIKLAPYYSAFIKTIVSSGKFRDEGEVVKAGLELLDKELKHLAALEKSILDGEKSGFATPFDNDAFKQKMADKYIK